MNDSMRLDVRPFRCGTDKEAALKPLEEAAEAYASWQTLSHSAVLDGIGFNPHIERREAELADELADCVTACANLAARYGLDLQAALVRVEKRNEERGRY